MVKKFARAFLVQVRPFRTLPNRSVLVRGVVHTELQLPKGFHIDAGWIGLTLTWLGKGKKKQRLFIQLYQAEIHCVAAAVACCVTKVFVKGSDL